MKIKIFQVPLEMTLEQVIKLPQGAIILSCMEKYGSIYIYYVCDTSRPIVERKFAIIETSWRTGEDYPDTSRTKFIGSVLNNGFPLHIFDMGELPVEPTTMINAPYPLSKELTDLVKDVPTAASPQPDKEEQSTHGLFFVAPDGTIIAEVEDVLEGGWTHLRTPIKGYDVVSYKNGKPIPNDGPLTPDQPSKIIPV